MLLLARSGLSRNCTQSHYTIAKAVCTPSKALGLLLPTIALKLVNGKILHLLCHFMIIRPLVQSHDKQAEPKQTLTKGTRMFWLSWTKYYSLMTM